jgi:hypothetical protein
MEDALKIEGMAKRKSFTTGAAFKIESIAIKAEIPPEKIDGLLSLDEAAEKNLPTFILPARLKLLPPFLEKYKFVLDG